MAEKIDLAFVKSRLKKRNSDSAKWDYGKVLLFTGSLGMAGAAVLCGRGAVRAGAGMARYSVPEELIPILQIAVPEIMCENRDLTAPDSSYDCVAIGPGLGDHEDDARLIFAFLHDYKGRIVLDADGLNDIVRYGMGPDLARSEADIILTPHMGEAARLLGIERADDREKCAVEVAAKYCITAIVKGPGTAVASPDGKLMTNTTGNAGMASGGSGDVLTGITAAIFAQGYSAFDAAAIAVFIHGMAGDRCADKFGETGMSSADIPDETALAIKDIVKQ